MRFIGVVLLSDNLAYCPNLRMKFAKVLFTLSFLISLFSVPVFRAVSQKIEPGQTTITYGTQEDANTYVPPPQIQRTPTQRRGVRSVQSQFIVTYNGFTTEARAAFQYAVDIWASLLQTSVPVRIGATFTDLGGAEDGFIILGTAGPDHRIVFSNTDVWLVGALADAIAGRDTYPGQADLNANFNSNDAVSWYYGTDGNTPSGKMDFVSVVLHEIGHGLGFISGAGVSETTGGVIEGRLKIGQLNLNYIYDTFVVNGSETAITTFDDPSAALFGQLTSNNLFWDGQEGKTANGGNRPRLYAPTTWDPGGTYTHLDESTFPAGNSDSLMTPLFERAEAIHHPGPITLGMFEDMGWTINRSPVFVANTATRSVAENTAVGVNIGTPVTAIDANPSDTLTYSLSGTDAASFDVESTTGQLKTKAPLNYETKRVYRVTVTANDGSLEGAIAVTINVTDVNDAPVFATNSTTRSIIEGTVADRNIGAPVSATDEDSGDILTYTLGGTDAASFDIESTTGQLKTKVALNYETKNTYSVLVIATDKDGLPDFISVTINIDIVVFTDSGLAAAVRSALRIGSDAPIPEDALAALTNLTASRRSITDLTGLEYATGLEDLDLGNNEITDVASLRNLTLLKTLDLADNQIEIISILAGLSNLENLDLDDNQIENVSTLPSLSNLARLELRDNDIGNVTPLSTMTHLTHLYLSGNDNLINIKQLVKLKNAGTIIDITLPRPVNIPDENLAAALRPRVGVPTGDPIFPEDMEQLTTFTASGQSIAILTGLEIATSLTRLTLSNNQITSLSPLSRLTSLETLELSDNEIVSLSSLSGLTNLTDLNLSANQISSISSLSRLTRLESLDLSKNEIVSLSSLSGLSSLTSLDLSDNQITNVFPLRDLSSLTDLYLSDNPDITNAEVLYKLEQGGTTITLPTGITIPTNVVEFKNTDLEAAVRSALRIATGYPILPNTMTDLTSLTVTRKEIADLTGLEGATALTRLDLGDNAIVNIGPLSGLTNLTSLDLADNQIVVLSSLSGLSSLESLDLDDNQVENVSALSGLSSLETLDLRDNDVMDVTPLSTMTHLTHLYLRGNGNLTNIKQLVKLEDTSIDITLPKPVNVPDANLATALRTAIGLPTGDPIFPEDMEQLTSLTASGRSITDLTGLETATNLTSLTLSNNTIVNLGPLSNLSSLQTLNLSNNQITDVSSLAGLTSLRTLDLSNNQIMDVMPLAGLTGLTRLDLTGNSGITNPEVLYKLKQDGTTITGIDIPEAVVFGDDNLEAAVKKALRIAETDPILESTLLTLERLTVTRKEIADLTGLEQATALTRLDLGDNAIVDLGPLSGLTNLTSLDLADNQIVDVFPLRNLTNLTSLDLDGNQIENVSPLPSLSGLQTLDLTYNDVGDVTPLSTMTHLRNLYLRGNENLINIKQLVRLKNAGTTVDITLPSPVNISDDNLEDALQIALGLQTDDPIFPEDMETLTTFNAPNRSITTLTGLEKAINLTSLNLSNNEISSISPLSRLTKLETLNLSDNTISSISSLSALTLLTDLNLSNNRISSVSSLSRLTSLETLNLSDNRISSLSTLSKLTALTELDLSNNQIRDVLPLQGLSLLRRLNLDGNTNLTQEKAAVLYKLQQGGTTITLPQGITLPTATDIVVFNNAALEAAVRSALRITTGYPIVTSKITDLTSLTATYKNIDDLSGLEGATGLTRLDLGNNAIVDLGPLLGLTTNLEELDLADNQIAYVSPLRNLTNLTNLDLDDNQIEDVSALSGLTSLRTLDLRGNDVMDATPLKDLTSLTYIYLLGNENLTNLEWLGALENLRSDIRLPDVVRLLDTNLDAAVRTALRIAGNTVSNDLPMSEELLESLEMLTVSNRRIANLSGLEASTGLTSLDLRNNDITNVSPLSKLYDLETLMLEGNPILDTSVLRELERRGTTIDITIYRYPSWDVNQDGDVDEADVFLITATITGESPDVNGDGSVDADDDAAADANKDESVNTDDLLLVFEKFDRPVNLAAPLLSAKNVGLDWRLLEQIDADRLRVQLEILRAENDGSLKYQQAIAFLQAVLVALHPNQTLLLANYPNPFNPETWIPYQLARGSNVQITIYDMRGVVVRQLELGYRAEGYYRVRGRAAHWDGRNGVGERVASGIYFYQLETDDVSLLRKMVILK